MSPAQTKTTVVNTSGERRYFDFLPPTGLYLNADEEFTAAGDINSWLRTKGAGPAREKMVKALDYALTEGHIAIKSGPLPIVFDPTLEETKSIGIDNGEIVLLPTTPAPTTTAGA